MPGKVLVEGPFQGVVFQEDLPVEGLVGSFPCHFFSSVEDQEDLHLGDFSVFSSYWLSVTLFSKRGAPFVEMAKEGARCVVLVPMTLPARCQ